MFPAHLCGSRHLPIRAEDRSLKILLEASVPGRHTHCMPWVNYCSYGQLSKPPGGVLENFLQIEVSSAGVSGGRASLVSVFYDPFVVPAPIGKMNRLIAAV